MTLWDIRSALAPLFVQHLVQFWRKRLLKRLRKMSYRFTLEFLLVRIKHDYFSETSETLTLYLFIFLKNFHLSRCAWKKIKCKFDIFRRLWMVASPHFHAYCPSCSADVLPLDNGSHSCSARCRPTGLPHWWVPIFADFKR